MKMTKRAKKKTQKQRTDIMHENSINIILYEGKKKNKKNREKIRIH